MGALASGGDASQWELLFGGAREFTPQLYCCSTAAAKKNDGGRLVIPQGLQIGFCLEWNRLLRHDASRVNHLKVREKTGYPSEQPSRSQVLRNPLYAQNPAMNKMLWFHQLSFPNAVDRTGRSRAARTVRG